MTGKILKYYVFPVGAFFGPLFVVVWMAVNWQVTLAYLGVFGAICLYHLNKQGHIRLF
jgi:hypothetical protein